MDNKDEKVVTKTSGPVCQKAMYAFYGSIIYLVVILLETFVFNKSSGALTGILGLLEIVFFFGSIILGAISLNEIKKKALSGKKFAVMGIILPIAFFILVLIIVAITNTNEFKESFEQGYNCPTATDCVDNGDGTSTCQVDGKDFKCPNIILKSSQYK